MVAVQLSNSNEVKVVQIPSGKTVAILQPAKAESLVVDFSFCSITNYIAVLTEAQANGLEIELFNSEGSIKAFKNRQMALGNMSDKTESFEEEKNRSSGGNPQTPSDEEKAPDKNKLLQLLSGSDNMARAGVKSKLEQQFME